MGQVKSPHAAWKEVPSLADRYRRVASLKMLAEAACVSPLSVTA